MFARLRSNRRGLAIAGLGLGAAGVIAGTAIYDATRPPTKIRAPAWQRSKDYGHVRYGGDKAWSHKKTEKWLNENMEYY